MSDALNELKKATMASYLAKAGRTIRADTTIAASFDDDYHKHLRVANQNHPNMITPGFEKSPEKLKHAEQQMKVNAELRDKFKLGAKNRIKGIARAGRLLAKESHDSIEAVKNATTRRIMHSHLDLLTKHGPQKVGDAIDAAAEFHGSGGLEEIGSSDVSAFVNTVKRHLGEAVEQLDEYKNTESHPSLWDTHELVHKSGKVLKKGDKVKTDDGTHKIVGFELPHHSGSTGRVYVHDKQAAFKMASYFPGVVDAKIRKKAVKEEAEPVNELKASTLASVATKRYAQAQAALKAKDFGGYVKGMKKSQTAADATVPKTGWSPEDDKKNEEVIPEVSAQEKYRQIKEARMAKAQKSTTTHHNFYIAHEDTDEAAGVLAQHKIPHSVADHSKAPVDHSVVSVRHKHYAAAKEAFKKNGIDFGGR